MSGLNARVPPGVVVSTPYTDAMSRPRMTYPFLYEPPAMWSLQNENPAMYRSVDVSNFLITPKSYSSFNRRLLAEEYGNELDLDFTDQRAIGPAPRRQANGKRERFDTEEEARDEEYRRIKRPTAVVARAEPLEPPPVPPPLLSPTLPPPPPPPKELGPAPPLAGPGLNASLNDRFQKDSKNKSNLNDISLAVKKELEALKKESELPNVISLTVKLEELRKRAEKLSAGDPGPKIVYTVDEAEEAKRIIADKTDVDRNYNAMNPSPEEAFKKYRSLSLEDRDHVRKETVDIGDELDALNRWDSEKLLIREQLKKVNNRLAAYYKKNPSEAVSEISEIRAEAGFPDSRRTSNRLGGERPMKRKNNLGP
jgi:hypothetical protein